MKKILLIAAIIGFASFASCSKGGDGGGTTGTLRVVQPDPVSFEGGNIELDIISNAGWAITAPDNGDWFTITELSGSGSKKVNIFVEKNEGISIRSSKFTVTTKGVNPREVTLYQFPEVMPVLDHSEVRTASSVGGDITFNVVTLPYDFEWEILQPEASWITSISPMSGNGRTAVTVTFAANDTGESRSASVMVVSSETLLEKEILLSQSKKLTIDDLVGNWKATGVYSTNNPNGSRTLSMEYNVIFGKGEDDETIVTENFLNFNGHSGANNDLYIKLTFDAETQTVSVPVQQMSGSLDKPVEQGGDGWPTTLYPYRFESVDDVWADKTGFENIPLYGASLEFVTDYEATAQNSMKVMGSFIPLTQNPNDPTSDVFHFSKTFWGDMKMSKIEE